MIVKRVAKRKKDEIKRKKIRKLEKEGDELKKK